MQRPEPNHNQHLSQADVAGQVQCPRNPVEIGLSRCNLGLFVHEQKFLRGETYDLGLVSYTAIIDTNIR